MHTVSQINIPAANMSGTTNNGSHSAPGANPISSDTTPGTHGVTGTDQGDTKTATGNSTHQSHAKGGGDASIVPQKVQEKLPEGVERAVPNALHDTGDQDGMHRKQD